MDAASTYLHHGEYDAACAELEAATARFVDYKLKIKKSLDESIAVLTTMGCPATPPHPKALPLVRLRQTL